VDLVNDIVYHTKTTHVLVNLLKSPPKKDTV